MTYESALTMSAWGEAVRESVYYSIIVLFSRNEYFVGMFVFHECDFNLIICEILLYE